MIRWLPMAALLLAYVVAEAAFNVRLIDVASSARLEADDIETLARQGKLLASFGLALLVMRFAIARLWSQGGVVVGLVFVGLWGGFYGAVVELFDIVLDRIPPEIQREAFDLMTFREAVMRGELRSISHRRDEGPPGIAQKLFLSNLPIQLVSAARAERVLERVNAWRSERARRAAEAAVRGRFDEAWAIYGAAQAGAVSRDSEMCRVESNERDMRVLIGDVPDGLDRPAFEARFLDLVGPCVFAQMVAKFEIGDHRAATAAAFLPPMSMTLSLFSMIVNLAAALGVIAAGLAGGGRRVAFVGMILPLVVIVGFFALTARQPFVEGSLPHRLHAQLPHRLGIVGSLWGHAINAQALVLEFQAEFLPAR